MESNLYYLGSIPSFLSHLGVGVGLLAAFVGTYVLVTPYRDFKMIGEGNTAPAIILAGALIGFVIPLASVTISSLNLMDMVVWGFVALTVQIVTFVAANLITPHFRQSIHDGQAAPAVVVASISLAMGVLNAACMTYWDAMSC